MVEGKRERYPKDFIKDLSMGSRLWKEGVRKGHMLARKKRISALKRGYKTRKMKSLVVMICL